MSCSGHLNTQILWAGPQFLHVYDGANRGLGFQPTVSSRHPPRRGNSRSLRPPCDLCPRDPELPPCVLHGQIVSDLWAYQPDVQLPPHTMPQMGCKTTAQFPRSLASQTPMAQTAVLACLENVSPQGNLTSVSVFKALPETTLFLKKDCFCGSKTRVPGSELTAPRCPFLGNL